MDEGPSREMRKRTTAWTTVGVTWQVPQWERPQPGTERSGIPPPPLPGGGVGGENFAKSPGKFPQREAFPNRGLFQNYACVFVWYIYEGGGPAMQVARLTPGNPPPGVPVTPVEAGVPGCGPGCGNPGTGPKVAQREPEGAMLGMPLRTPDVLLLGPRGGC